MADFSVTQSLSSHTSEEEDNGVEVAEEEGLQVKGATPTTPAHTLTNPTAVTTFLPTPPPPYSCVSTRRPRGRPPGSKNKPKPPIYIPRETEPAMKTLQLEIPAGCDIVEMVQKFSRKNRVGIHILNGSGTVSNFTLRHPPISLTGAFNLLSLSGSFMDPSIGSSSSSSSEKRVSSSFHPGGSAPWLTIFVGGNAGELFGGTVVGKAVAATNVVLNVNTFAGFEYHRVEPGEFAEEERREERSRGRPAGTGHVNWAPPATGRQPNHHF